MFGLQWCHGIARGSNTIPYTKSWPSARTFNGATGSPVDQTVRARTRATPELPRANREPT